MNLDLVPISNVETKPLPAGKLYHVFFSHSSEDSEWVQQAVERLESPELGYKCCYADRDFGVGIPVLQNITTCIHTSKRTVLVLSPEYLRSNWCTYEARITAELDIDTRMRILVPIMLRECNVPNFIGRLSYISVSNEHFWDRLIEAIDRSESGGSILGNGDLLVTFPPLGIYSGKENGQFLLERVVNEPCRASPNLAEFIPEELGYQITQEEYDQVMNILLGDYYLIYNGFFIFKFWILLVVLGVGFIMVLLFLPGLAEMWNVVVPLTGSLLGFLILFESAGFLLRFLSARRGTIRQMNRILFNKNILAGLCNNDRRAALCRKQLSVKFFYYNWTPCQGSRLIDRVTRNHHQPEEIQRTHLISSDNVAEEILLYFSTEYGDLLASRKQNQPQSQRHTNQGECLCQFVESFLDDTSQNSYRFSCIFGGPSRNPWRRLRFNDT